MINEMMMDCDKDVCLPYYSSLWILNGRTNNKNDYHDQW